MTINWSIHFSFLYWDIAGINYVVKHHYTDRKGHCPTKNWKNWKRHYLDVNICCSKTSMWLSAWMVLFQMFKLPVPWALMHPYALRDVGFLTTRYAHAVVLHRLMSVFNAVPLEGPNITNIQYCPVPCTQIWDSSWFPESSDDILYCRCSEIFKVTHVHFIPNHVTGLLRVSIISWKMFFIFVVKPTLPFCASGPTCRQS